MALIMACKRRTEREDSLGAFERRVIGALALEIGRCNHAGRWSEGVA